MSADTLRSQNAQTRFWNRIARRYARKPVPDQGVYETKLEKTRQLLKPTDRVLEVGCGTGTTALHLAPHVASVLATDISAGMLEIARGRAAQQGVSNATFEPAGLTEVKIPKTPYDVVLAHSVLHLVSDVPAALVHLARLLHPEGHLVLTVPCIGDSAPWFRWVGPPGAALGILPRVHVFRERNFLEWLERAGFEVAERWLPGPRRGVFLVAGRRPPSTG